MRPINVTLDSQTWELAKQKDNFSEWVRSKLRAEVQKNKKKWSEDWEAGKCHCGQYKNKRAPSHCTNHEAHEVKE